jgi:hypothetical protein
VRKDGQLSGTWMSRHSATTIAEMRMDKLSDSDRFQLALSQVAGKRLASAKVTGKVGETAS